MWHWYRRIPEERLRYGSLLAQLSSAWLKTLPTGSLKSSVVEYTDGGSPRPVAIGVSVFIADDFLRELKTLPRAWIGPALTNRVHGSNCPILTSEQIREANSNSGLNIAIWTGVVSDSDTEQMVHVELFRGFFDTHLGYQIKEIVCQPLDSRQILASFRAGLFWFSEEGIYVDGRSLRTRKLSDGPFLMGGDRETASRAFGSWFSGLLLSHTPARLYFRPTEQRLLAAALRGLTDEELAAELGVSLAAVKKTWRMIYERTLSILRDDAPDEAENEVFGKRGKEKKQHLLTYLRQHMEKLRPVLPPRIPGHAHQEHVRS